MRRFKVFAIVAALLFVAAVGGLALSAERDTPQFAGLTYAVPVKADTKVEKGTLVVLDAGYAAPGREATGLYAIGRAQSTVDNTGGGAGALTVVVDPGVYRWDNSAGGDAIAQAQVGAECYIVDAETVAKTDGTGTRSGAGVIVAVDSTGVWVATRLEDSLRGVNIAVLDARLDTEEAATTDYGTRLTAAEGEIDDLVAIDAGTRLTAAEGSITTLEGVAARRQTRILGSPAAPGDLHAAYAGGSGAIDDTTGPWTAIPLPARQVQVVCSASCEAGTATVTGTDEAGAAISEDLAIGNGLTTKGAKVFATITGFSTSVDPGAAQTVTLQTGPGIGLGGPVTAIHALSADGTREALVQSLPAVGLVEPTTAPDGSAVFAVQVTP